MNNILYFDLETTGLEVWKEKIVQMAIMYNDGSKCILVNPGISIPEQASYVHKITDEMVKDCPPFSYYAPHIYKLLLKCDAYSGYNIRKFDLPILALEMSRCGYQIPVKPVIDIFEIVNGYEPDKKLGSVYLRYFNEKLEGAHDALHDVKATKRIHEFILKKLS